MNEATVWFTLAKAVGETLDFPNLENLVTFEWSNKMSRTIANARPGRMLIHVNTDAWPFLDGDARDKVIVHELCHIVADNQSQTRVSHGYEWQRAMRKCGYSPDVCTKMPAAYSTAVAYKRRPQVKYTAWCRCGKHPVSFIRHKRIQKGIARYSCVKCKQTLTI